MGHDNFADFFSEYFFYFFNLFIFIFYFIFIFIFFFGWQRWATIQHDLTGWKIFFLRHVFVPFYWLTAFSLPGFMKKELAIVISTAFHKRLLGNRIGFLSHAWSISSKYVEKNWKIFSQCIEIRSDSIKFNSFIA